jgi:peptide/nickel transport system substrate-binding protein
MDVINRDYAYINLWHPNIVWIGTKCLQKIELEPTGGFFPLLKLEKSREGECGR